ncbi:MAG: hypothetical protein Q8J72_12590, partial [Rhodocyclaceae bacterium]|nr:hypothetical protein [Rhodocyclaceae bacterium]
MPTLNPSPITAIPGRTRRGSTPPPMTAGAVVKVAWLNGRSVERVMASTSVMPEASATTTMV